MLCHGSCKHTDYVNELVHQSENVIEDLEGIAALLSSPHASLSKMCSPMGISWKKTPFILSDMQKDILRNGFHDLVQLIDGHEVIVFPSDECQKCSSCESPVLASSTCLPLIVERNIITALGSYVSLCI